MKFKPTSFQRKAIEETGKNILVSAGAGSGKTGVLKERVKYKLEHGLHIDELIILTFTEAAAANMKERIIEVINKNNELEPELFNLNNAIISTFDSFCLKLVKDNHYLLNLPSNIKIGDNIQFLSMEKTVLEDTLKYFYTNNDEKFDELVLSLFQKGDNLLYETVANLAKKFLKEPGYTKIIDNFEFKYFNLDFINKKYDEFLDIISQQIKSAYNIYLELNKSVKNYNIKIDEYLNDIERYFKVLLNDKENVIKNILNLKMPRKPIIKADDDLKNDVNKYQTKFKNIITDLKNEIKKINAFDRTTNIERVINTKSMILKTIEITKFYIDSLNKKKKELSLYSFQDIMALAIKLLEDNQAVVGMYKNNIKEIMIDEYQDTNDLQEYFISLISNNNVFLVGDIKQSIYGFRDANPENFHKKYIEYSNNRKGIAIDLRENFRSRKEVLEEINKIFLNLMNEEIGGINYQDDQSLIYGLKEYENIAKNQHYGIDLIEYDYDSKSNESSKTSKIEIEGELLAKDVRNKIDNHYQIFDLKLMKFRNILYSDIAILTDTKANYKEFSRILNKYKIP